MSFQLQRRDWLLLALAGLAAQTRANEARFPTQPIKLVVPYPAGGNADTIARVFAKRLGEQLKTPVVVENKGGASGTIGAEAVHKSSPDGHTLLLTVTTQLTSSPMGMKTNYNAVQDFTPVVGLCITPLAFAVPASLGVKNLKELEALSKSRKVSYGSYGPGTSTHILQHLLMKQMGARDAAHVPYRGESPMVNDMLGGQIDMGFISIGQARELDKSGRMRVLAVVGTQRSEFLPDVPTFAEQGYKQLDWSYGVAVYASTRVPAGVLKTLQEAGRQVMEDPEVHKSYRAQSNQPWLKSQPEELRKRLALDSDNWNRILSELGQIE